jgi:hypothetical protein
LLSPVANDELPMTTMMSMLRIMCRIFLLAAG